MNTPLPLSSARACALLSAPLLWLVAATAHGQGLEDSLKEHVKEGIEKKKERDKDKKDKSEQEEKTKKDGERGKEQKDATNKDKPADDPKNDEPRKKDAKPIDDENTIFSFSTEDPDEPEEPEAPEEAAEQQPEKKEKKLPVRVFGKSFKLDIKFGGGVRGWFPQQYDAVDVDFANYYTFNVSVKAKLFRFLNIRRGYVESNSISGPKTDEAATAAEIGSFAPKALWVLGVLGVPITKAWEPVIRYEARAFETKARRREGVGTVVCVIPRDVDEDVECPDPSLDTLSGPDDRLKIVSSFETFVAGVRYDHSKSGGVVAGDRKRKKGKIPPLFFGVGLMSYRKPYQLTIGTDTLEENLFDGRFRGAGLALGTELGGGLDNFFSDIDMQVGLGEVSLTDDLTLNEILNDVFPNEFLVGYVQGTASLGYKLPLIRAAPTLIFVPQVKAGGASFFLIDTKVDENEEATSPTVNWDFLWTVQASLLVPL